MAEDSKRVWDLLARHSIGMLMTRFSGGLRSRPLDARPKPNEGAIFFLIDARALKDDEIAQEPLACFVVINEREGIYLSISGEARMSADPERANAIWKPSDDATWPQRERDPNLRVLRLEPRRAELWDGPKGNALATFEMHQPPDAGRKKSIDLSI